MRPFQLIGAAGDPWVACLDARATGSELILRPRQPGDRFQPQGMAGHSMKLNEFMINLKVPKDTRAGWPLLIGRDGIAWVCGLRVAEWAAVRETTTRGLGRAVLALSVTGSVGDRPERGSGRRYIYQSTKSPIYQSTKSQYHYHVPTN